MSNSLGTLSGSLILQRALTLTFTHRPLLKMISKGFRELDGKVDNALLNQTVISRLKSVQTVNPFGTGPGNVTDTDVPVTLSAQKEVHVQFTPAQYNATDRDLIEESAEPIAVAIANHIVDSVSANWTTTNFSTSVTPASTYSYTSLMLPLLSALDANGVPQDNRFAVVNSTVYASLLSDPLIVAALNNPLNGDAIAKGNLPEVAGFQLDKYPSFSSAGASGVGFAGHPESTVFVARAPKNPAEVMPNVPFPGLIDYIEDPITGFRVMVNQWVDPYTLAVNNRLTWLEGYAVGDAVKGCVINAHS
jgi:hypothetical protein